MLTEKKPDRTVVLLDDDQEAMNVMENEGEGHGKESKDQPEEDGPVPLKAGSFFGHHFGLWNTAGPESSALLVSHMVFWKYGGH